MEDGANVLLLALAYFKFPRDLSRKEWTRKVQTTRASWNPSRHFVEVELFTAYCFEADTTKYI